MFRRAGWLSVGWLSGLLLVGACGGRALEVEPIAITDNPTEQINLLTKEVAKGRDKNLHVLSPTLFGQAEASLNKATALRDKGRDISKILEAVALGRAQARKAEATAEVSKLTLPQALKARTDARKAGAEQFDKDYAKAEGRLVKLTASIEQNDLQWAQENEAATAGMFRSLELRAISQKALGSAIAVVERAKSNGAKKLAPGALAEAEKQLEIAESSIAKDRYSTETIQQVAQKARFFADRAFQLTEEGRKLKGLDPDEIALRMESMLAGIRAELPAPDARDQSLTDQARGVRDTIDSIKQGHQMELAKLRSAQDELARQTELQKTELTAKATAKERELMERAEVQSQEFRQLKEQLAAITGQSQSEQEQRRRLEAKIRLNELYAEVQKYFESKEAEVYKQGNELLIRLKGIQFPVGQHVIMPGNFTLLSKVQRAIRSFGEPEIVVEGHTDSTGSDETNQTLSQLRAESVREYLVANDVTKYEKIQAVGFGSMKPIASNETVDGRANNRRIDVVIRPTGTASN